ncbi:MAG: bifunctional oligoribonuclease/PAP phosphatase NrnA [Candidatus Vogelbacteria bacterium]
MTDQVKKLAPQILDTIKSAKRILLHFHPNPDPDSVGSALAMTHALRGLGKEVTVIKGDSPMPEYLSFLPGYELITPKSYLEIDPTEFDLFLMLDISQPNRVTALGEINLPTLKTILIDHHITAEPFAELNLIVPEYPATAQILGDLFHEWGIKLTPAIAACLFIGLYSDTGGFKYQGTTKDTFLAVATLVELAPNFTDLVFQMENNKTPAQLRYEGLALSSIELVGNGKAALVVLSQAQLAAAGIRYEDVQGISIANHLKSVTGWEIGATLIESAPGVTRASFRTRDPKRFDLSKIAAALGGGGHPAAAGAVLKMAVAAARDLVVRKMVELYPLLSIPPPHLLL